jgi:SNF2 family DNA or RNA helicase
MEQTHISLPVDGRVKALLADRVTEEGNEMLVPHDLTSTKLLRSLGYEVPAPVLTQYDWAGLTPYEVQKKTVAMLTTEKRAYVLNGLGTGKTMCSLWAYDYLRKAGQVKKALIVAPLSTLNFVWEREVFYRMPHLKAAVLHGTKVKRLQALNSDADLYIVNHDGVATVYDELMARDDIDMLILDELSAYRNGSSQRNKLMRKLAEKTEWVYGLTGSPCPRDPTDVWGQAVVITPKSVPKYFNHFRQDLCYKYGPFRWVPKDDAIDKAFAAMQPSVRYSLDDVLELPAVTMQMEQIELGKKQKEIYKNMKNKAVAMIGEGKIDALNAGAVLSKLLQISCGYVYNREGQSFDLDNEARVEKIVETIDACERKAIVFVPFKNALTGLGNALEAAGIDFARISGDTPVSERKNIFNAFQNTQQYKVLLAHPQTMAHGLTLTAADTIIWASPITDLEVFMQANGRISRIGQVHKQLVKMIWGSPVERRVYESLSRKEDMQIQLLDLIREASD